MITLKQYAKIIENQLNENAHAKAFKFQFKVWADVGDYQNAFNNQVDYSLINCVLRETSGNYTPVKVAKTKFAPMVFEAAIGQEQEANLRVVLEDWAANQLGVIYSAYDITYMVTPGAIVPGTAVNTCELGSTIPLSMTIELQSTELGLIANEMVWTISVGDIVKAEVEVLNFEIGSARTQQTADYINKDKTSSSNQMATKSIMLRIPIAKTEICKKLFNDILADNKDEVYTIEETDGWSSGINDKFIIASGQLIGDTTKIVALQCTFLKSDEQME